MARRSSARKRAVIQQCDWSAMAAPGKHVPAGAALRHRVREAGPRRPSGGNAAASTLDEDLCVLYAWRAVLIRRALAGTLTEGN